MISTYEPNHLHKNDAVAVDDDDNNNVFAY